MDEYLFFQKNKKYLQDTKSVLSPKIFSSKGQVENESSFGFGTRESTVSAFPRAQSPRGEKQDIKLPPIQKVNLKNVEIGPSLGLSTSELTAETMKGSLKQLSGNYTEQYTASGFPPKICTLILKEISEGANKLKCNVLDVGCGKGHVGEYLKHDGFLHITGMDCSKNLLQLAEQKKAYEKLERVAIGEVDTDRSHNEKYDFVVSSSMINNDGWDDQVFLQLLNYTKMGGFIIFATKLNLNQENQYGPEISRLAEEQYWKFVTEHTFYRYDKLCNGHGKFSNKMVKIVAYQKTDHNVWLEQEKDRLEEEARIRAHKQAVIDEKIRTKEAKLNGAQNDRKKRKMLQEKESSMKLQAEMREAEEAEEAARKAAEDAEAAKQRQKQEAERMKQALKEAMWAKLKAAQAEEVARREALKQEMLKKVEEAKLDKEKTFNPAG